MNLNSSSILKILWFACAACHVILFGIAQSGLFSTGPASPASVDLYPRLGGVAALDWLLAWWVMPKVMARGIRQRTQASKASPFQVISIFVVQWALFEAVTLMGFLVVVNTRRPETMLPFFVAGLLGVVLTFPSAARMEMLQKAITPSKPGLPQ